MLLRHLFMLARFLRVIDFRVPPPDGDTLLFFLLFSAHFYLGHRWRDKLLLPCVPEEAAESEVIAPLDRNLLQKRIVLVVHLGAPELCRHLCADPGYAFFIRPARWYGELTPSSGCELGRPVSNHDVAIWHGLPEHSLQVVEKNGEGALLASVQREALARPPWARVLRP